MSSVLKALELKETISLLRYFLIGIYLNCTTCFSVTLSCVFRDFLFAWNPVITRYYWVVLSLSRFPSRRPPPALSNVASSEVTRRKALYDSPYILFSNPESWRTDELRVNTKILPQLPSLWAWAEYHLRAPVSPPGGPRVPWPTAGVLPRAGSRLHRSCRVADGPSARCPRAGWPDLLAAKPPALSSTCFSCFLVEGCDSRGIT